MNNWIDEAIIYHIYPIGFCGAPKINTGRDAANRLEKIIEWIPHLKDIGINTVMLGPVFESSTHGYDTCDYRKIDSRLGTNESFKKICDILHANGIRVVLDGVFNHVGRQFWAFENLRDNLSYSLYKDWFCNVNFNNNSCYGDGFSYDAWENHYELVKLNLNNQPVVDYLIDAVKMWIKDFGIDGLRLDAASCICDSFFKTLKNVTKSIKSDFWLMGEVIHGDYNKWANESMLDSVTNYECYKGLYSSHNDKNYFEIAHSLNRQFASGGIYSKIKLYNFVDNHDVNRIASTLKNLNHLKNVYAMEFAMPGIPSIYYGSEFGIRGMRTDNNDDALRPCLELNNIPDKNQNLLDFIKKIGALRKDLPALEYGGYENVVIKNEQLIFKRMCTEQTVYCAFNLSQSEEVIQVKINNANVLADRISGKEFFVQNNAVSIRLQPFSAMYLEALNNSEPEPVGVDDKSNGVIVGGRYHHFKGGDYIVICVGKNTETLEEMVVYKELNGSNVWIRPTKVFLEEVNVYGGGTVPRFDYICKQQ